MGASEVVLSVIAGRDPGDVTVGRVLEGVRARLATSLDVESGTLRFDFGLGALSEFGVTRKLERASPLAWHDDLEVFELDVILAGVMVATLSIRHGCLDWDQQLPVPLEACLASAVGPERAARALALDTVWWFSAARTTPADRAVAAALACAIAELCDGILCESDDESVFASPSAFLGWLAR